HLLLVDLWPHFYALIQAISDLQFLRTIDQTVGKLPVDALLDDYAAGRRASLSGGSEGSPQDAVESQVKVSIVQNDNCIFAAHLQRARLECSRCHLAHLAANFTRSGEGDGAYVRVLNDGSARIRTKTGDDIDYTLG